MKTVDLTRETHTLDDLLSLAKKDALLIHSEAGEDYFLEQADDFQKEVATLGASEKFMSFLRDRAKEQGGKPLDEVMKRRGTQAWLRISKGQFRFLLNRLCFSPLTGPPARGRDSAKSRTQRTGAVADDSRRIG